MDIPLNADTLEIILSFFADLRCVLNGVLAFALYFLTPESDTSACYETETLFRHVSLEALDPESLNKVIDQLYVPDDEFIKYITQPHPERLKLKGINMFYVKYSHIDFNLVQYYNHLYKQLEQQTNGFDPVELGKRIVFVPGTIPKNFDGIVEIFEPLTEDFKLCSKFLKSHYFLDESFKDVTSMNEFLNTHGAYFPDMQTYKKAICDFMVSDKDPNGLSLEKLESYREKYEACITVTPDSCRLYTRARFIFNIFVELNDHVIKHIAASPNKSHHDTLSRLYEFLGMSARNILTNQHHLYLDDGNYPVISELYRTGSIRPRLFPESINYTKIQKLCFCQWCQPFEYSAQLYEGCDGTVYILVNLRGQDYTNYIDFIESKRCMYNLFMSDIEYHYGRLDALDSWRYKLEAADHRVSMSIEKLLKLLNEIGGQSWFSPQRRAYMRMDDADRMLFRIKSGF